MYIKNLIKEIKIWKIVKKTVTENKGKLNELGFDVDWIGRIYTVIDIPDALNNLPQKSINETIERNIAVDMYIKEQLGPLSNLLNELRLSELIMYPEYYEQFDGTNSVLVVLSPDRKYTKFWKLFGFLFATGLVVAGVIVMFNLLFL